MGFLAGYRKNRQLTPEHKFEYINLRDFNDKSFVNVTAYIWIYLSILISLSCVAADTYTAITLLVFNRWSSQIQPVIPFEIAKIIFAVCILISYVLIIADWLFALKVIRRGGVADAYMNVIALRWNCVWGGKDEDDTGWRRFLVFARLTKQRGKTDYVALFTYFSFKGWVRIVFAEGPRVVINAFTLASVIDADLVPKDQLEPLSKLANFFINIQHLWSENRIQVLILSSMTFTTILWAFAILQLLLACLLFLTFLWHVMAGESLRKYCKVRIDTRMGEIVNANHKAGLKEDTVRKAAAGILRAPTIPVSAAVAMETPSYEKGYTRGGTPVAGEGVGYEKSYMQSPVRGFRQEVEVERVRTPVARVVGEGVGYEKSYMQSPVRGFRQEAEVERVRTPVARVVGEGLGYEKSYIQSPAPMRGFRQEAEVERARTPISRVVGEGLGYEKSYVQSPAPIRGLRQEAEVERVRTPIARVATAASETRSTRNTVKSTDSYDSTLALVSAQAEMGYGGGRRSGSVESLEYTEWLKPQQARGQPPYAASSSGRSDNGKTPAREGAYGMQDLQSLVSQSGRTGQDSYGEIQSQSRGQERYASRQGTPSRSGSGRSAYGRFPIAVRPPQQYYGDSPQRTQSPGQYFSEQTESPQEYYPREQREYYLPRLGTPQQPPRLGTPQQPPRLGTLQQPPRLGTPQQPPRLGTPQQPPRLGTPQQLPQQPQPVAYEYFPPEQPQQSYQPHPELPRLQTRAPAPSTGGYKRPAYTPASTTAPVGSYFLKQDPVQMRSATVPPVRPWRAPLVRSATAGPDTGRGYGRPLQRNATGLEEFGGRMV